MGTGDAYELSEFLSTIRPGEIASILRYIPDLLKHRSWMVKTDTLDLIAKANLKQFEKSVLMLLKKEKYYLTKKIALQAYFELAGKRAIPVLQKYTKDRYRIVRLVALCQLYLVLRKKNILNQIVEMTLEKGSGTLDHYFVCNFMLLNLNAKRYPEVNGIVKKILDQLDPSASHVKQIKKYLKGKLKATELFGKREGIKGL